MTTLQAISGAGYPGVPSMAIMDNVVPYIGGEEEKIEQEARLLLGSMRDGQRVEASLTCIRRYRGSRLPSCDASPLPDGGKRCH